jgi:hypothetical protein
MEKQKKIQKFRNSETQGGSVQARVCAGLLAGGATTALVRQTTRSEVYAYSDLFARAPPKGLGAGDGEALLCVRQKLDAYEAAQPEREQAMLRLVARIEELSAR